MLWKRRIVIFEAIQILVIPLCRRVESSRSALLPFEEARTSGFYVEQSNHIDVWRVLHGVRDIPSSMQDPDLI
jgi:plasmid stabilization system protein ParE